MEPTIYYHVYPYWSIFWARLIQSAPYFYEAQLKALQMVAYFKRIGFPITTLYASLSCFHHSPPTIYLSNWSSYWYSLKCNQHAHSVALSRPGASYKASLREKRKQNTQPRDKPRQLVSFTHNTNSKSVITPTIFQWEKYTYIHTE
jgi:hypothetical protein